MITHLKAHFLLVSSRTSMSSKDRNIGLRRRRTLSTRTDMEVFPWVELRDDGRLMMVYSRYDSTGGSDYFHPRVAKKVSRTVTAFRFTGYGARKFLFPAEVGP